MQAYIKVLFVYLTLVFSLSFTTFSAGAKSVVVILIVAALLALPPMYTTILHRNRASLDTLSLKEKIGSLYLGVRV